MLLLVSVSLQCVRGKLPEHPRYTVFQLTQSEIVPILEFLKNHCWLPPRSATLSNILSDVKPPLAYPLCCILSAPLKCILLAGAACDTDHKESFFTVKFSIDLQKFYVEAPISDPIIGGQLVVRFPSRTCKPSIITSLGLFPRPAMDI